MHRHTMMRLATPARWVRTNAPVDEQQPTMGENDIGFNYYMYPTIHRMALSPARLKFIVGAAGSGKTSGIIWTLLLQAIMQEPAADGVRYSRALVARNTNSMLRSTTIPSFKTMVG